MRTEYCSKCGSILEPNAAFCGECGAPVTSKDEKEPAVQQTSFWQQSNSTDSSIPSQGDNTTGNTASSETSFSPSENGFEQPQGNFQQSQNSFQQPQDNFQQPQDSFQQPQDSFQQSQGNFQQPQGGFQQPQGNFQQPQGGFQQSQGNFQQSQGGFQQSQGGFQQPQGGFQQFHGNNPYASRPNGSTSNQKTIVLILGIVAIIFALLYPLIAYPASIVGLVLASKAKKAGENVQGGFICCIIGLVLAILNSLLGVILALANFAYYL